jgi:hypothetical protein
MPQRQQVLVCRAQEGTSTPGLSQEMLDEIPSSKDAIDLGQALCRENRWGPAHSMRALPDPPGKASHSLQRHAATPSYAPMQACLPGSTCRHPLTPSPLIVHTAPYSFISTLLFHSQVGRGSYRLRESAHPTGDRSQALQGQAPCPQRRREVRRSVQHCLLPLALGRRALGAGLARRYAHGLHACILRALFLAKQEPPPVNLACLPIPWAALQGALRLGTRGSSRPGLTQTWRPSGLTSASR